MLGMGDNAILHCRMGDYSGVYGGLLRGVWGGKLSAVWGLTHGRVREREEGKRERRG